MHELGVVMQVIRVVEDLARQNGLTKIQTVVLQIGELSSTIPRYVEACYPAAVHGTLLADTELKVEVLVGTARCRACGQVFKLIENNNLCSSCRGEDWEILSGKEFLIKEIVAC